MGRLAYTTINRTRNYSGNESQFILPFSFLTNKYRLSLKIKVNSFPCTSTSNNSCPFIPSNFTITSIVVGIFKNFYKIHILNKSDYERINDISSSLDFPSSFVGSVKLCFPQEIFTFA